VLTRKRLQRQLSKLRCVDGCSSSQTDRYLTGKHSQSWHYDRSAMTSCSATVLSRIDASYSNCHDANVFFRFNPLTPAVAMGYSYKASYARQLFIIFDIRQSARMSKNTNDCLAQDAL